MSLVGVMDSGIGGLTVLNQLRNVAPQCDYLYVADQAFFPYGTKNFQQIRLRVVAVALYLKNQGVQNIVVACNTASLFADEICNATGLTVTDVINPTCNATMNATRSKRVALLATDATVACGVYQHILAANGIHTVAFPCSSLVPLAENNAPESLRMQTVRSCLYNLPSASVDTVILGCTHFPYLQDEIATCCKGCNIVSCAEPTAISFKQSVINCGSGTVRYLTTGRPSQNADKFLKFDFEQITI